MTNLKIHSCYNIFHTILYRDWGRAFSDKDEKYHCTLILKSVYQSHLSEHLSLSWWCCCRSLWNSQEFEIDGRMSHLRRPMWFHSWPHSLSTFSCQVAIIMEWNGFMFLLTCVPCFNRLYALRNYKSKRKTSTIR